MGSELQKPLAIAMIGLMLMVVGMATVFVILLIVIYLSKYLITVVNKVAPEEAPKKAPAVALVTAVGAGNVPFLGAVADMFNAVAVCPFNLCR